MTFLYSFPLENFPNLPVIWHCSLKIYWNILQLTDYIHRRITWSEKAGSQVILDQIIATKILCYSKQPGKEVTLYWYCFKHIHLECITWKIYVSFKSPGFISPFGYKVLHLRFFLSYYLAFPLLFATQSFPVFIYFLNHKSFAQCPVFSAMWKSSVKNSFWYHALAFFLSLVASLSHGIAYTLSA